MKRISSWMVSGLAHPAEVRLLLLALQRCGRRVASAAGGGEIGCVSFLF